MKKILKDAQEKEMENERHSLWKKKNSRVSKCTKDIVQLQVQFVSILPCLNLTIISSGLI